MEKVRREDILNLIEYGKIREDFRRKIIQLKTPRRVNLGDKLSFLFENRASVIFQIEEMIWAERIVDEADIQKLIDIYNTLLPAEHELSATLYIQLENDEQLKAQLKNFIGVAGSVYLKVGNSTVRGIPEEGRETSDQVSTVQYVKFKFRPEDIELFKSGDTPVHLGVSHPHYRAEVELSPETRESLAEDFKK